jgi:uncharacterized protein (TIGR02246 family)
MLLRLLRPTLTALVLSAGLATAAEPPAMSPDELAVRENAGRYAEAFNAGDAKALAAMWAPEAVYVDSDTGTELKGRAAIEAHFTAQLAGPRPTIAVDVTSVRFVTPDVAMEDGVVHIAAADGAMTDTSYSAVSVKKDGKWLLDSVRETTLPPPPTSFDHLQPLAWLVGEWVDGDDANAVHSMYRWSAEGAFLTNTFTAITEGGIDLRGTQIIGWDPSEQRIRSWVFDSDGGFGEGAWTQEGDRWVVQSTSTLPDGRKGSAINVYQRLDDNSFSWKSTARHAGDEILPNSDEVLVQRVVPTMQSAVPSDLPQE